MIMQTFSHDRDLVPYVLQRLWYVKGRRCRLFMCSNWMWKELGYVLSRL